ncbi:MAG: glutathione S-transferase N-terminal domain-containing protein [bacterium]|nr:glutathione S-transferase N-terminal domain-containing protein [bacterium]
MLELFISETCPYCQKVMKFMDERKVKYKKFDIANEASEYALIKLGGKRQVPFLVDKDRNVQMYESADIIEYVKTIL